MCSNLNNLTRKQWPIMKLFRTSLNYFVVDSLVFVPNNATETLLVSCSITLSTNCSVCMILLSCVEDSSCLFLQSFVAIVSLCASLLFITLVTCCDLLFSPFPIGRFTRVDRMEKWSVVRVVSNYQCPMPIWKSNP